MGQEFQRPIVKKTEFCRWVHAVSVEGVGESWSLGDGTGELLLEMGSLEGGGLGGKRVILLQLLLILIVDEDLEGGSGPRRGRRRQIGLRETWVFLVSLASLRLRGDVGSVMIQEMHEYEEQGGKAEMHVEQGDKAELDSCMVRKGSARESLQHDSTGSPPLPAATNASRDHCCTFKDVLLKGLKRPAVS
ncbi:hypothetical protein SASPL_123484 [Salvia splendens]|uniref:Uncharacterized protein n=1 Tax=Salvia splendens TaxID=180675 RepID=A0A8X8XNN1_SALSN|nr:hypothetical protein SASPL_123484 [Salvia splendens]